MNLVMSIRDGDNQVQQVAVTVTLPPVLEVLPRESVAVIDQLHVPFTSELDT